MYQLKKSWNYLKQNETKNKTPNFPLGLGTLIFAIFFLWSIKPSIYKGYPHSRRNQEAPFPLLMVPRWLSGHLGAIPTATWWPSYTPQGESCMDRPDTWTVMVTWLPSMTLRSERPCRKMGATGLLGVGGRRCSLSPSLFFSVWWK